MEKNGSDPAAEFTPEVVPFIGSLSTPGLILVSLVVAVLLFLGSMLSVAHVFMVD